MRTNDSSSQPDAREEDVERLSEDFKQQVELAKARISDRYGKLMETRSFEPGRGREGKDQG